MRIGRILRNTLLTILGIVVVLIMAVGLTLWLGVTINLNVLRAPIADAANKGVIMFFDRESTNR
jgi:hypothetical protein